MTNIVLLSTCLITNYDGMYFKPDANQPTNSFYMTGNYEYRATNIYRLSTIGFFDGTNQVVIGQISKKEGK